MTKKLNIFEIKGTTLPKIFGNRWHKISCERLQRNLDIFEFESQEQALLNIKFDSTVNINKLIREPNISLVKRNKGERVSFWEWSFIYKDIKPHGICAYEAARKFSVSRSTIYSIIKNVDSECFSSSGKNSREN